MNDKEMSEQEAFDAEEALKSYVNSLSCKSFDEVHWKLRVLLSVTCGMIESIEAGRTEEIKQH